MKYELNRELLLEYIQNDLDIGQISNITNIHRSKILYSLAKQEQNDEYSKIIRDYISDNIIFKTYNDSALFMIIADVHMCSLNQRLDYLYKAYEYAVLHKIKEVYVVGDFIHSILSGSIESCKDYESQINYFINHFPYDENIQNNLLFGNHEYYLENNSGYDICSLLEQARDDFNVLGYKRSYVNICGNNVCFKHQNITNKLIVPTISHDIKFSGHHHYVKYSREFHHFFRKQIHEYYVPHLSYFNNNQSSMDSSAGFYLVKAYDNDTYNKFNILYFGVDDKVHEIDKNQIRLYKK